MKSAKELRALQDSYHMIEISDSHGQILNHMMWTRTKVGAVVIESTNQNTKKHIQQTVGV